MRALAVTVLLLLSSCALFRSGKNKALEAEEISSELAQAEVEMTAGQAEAAARRLMEVQDLEDLDTITRHRVELLLERAGFEWLGALLEANADSDDLVDLYEEDDLPGRARVSAGVAAAQRMLEEGEPLEAFLMIKRVDKAFPTNHERAAAGDVVAQSGFALARSTKRKFFVFRLKDRASEALEYLVLTYPSHASCEEAYLRLAAIYEDDDELELAQERHEELLLFYPASQFATFAEAQIPELRIRRILGPRYDRSELHKAQGELEAWLARHPNDDLRDEVARTLLECNGLLVENDLIVAGFYARVDEDFGVRFHAERALLLAREIEDPELEARAAKLHAKVASESLDAPPGGLP